MNLFDGLVVAALLAAVLALIVFMVWGEVARVYHWRKAIDRIDKTEWTRVLIALRAQGRE